jgi:hypothetical protein
MYNKTTQELGNKKIIVISKAWLTQILKTKQQYQQTYVNTICKSIKHYHYLDHFPICQETNGVSKESTRADNMKHYTAENYTIPCWCYNRSAWKFQIISLYRYKINIVLCLLDSIRKHIQYGQGFIYLST